MHARDALQTSQSQATRTFITKKFIAIKAAAKTAILTADVETGASDLKVKFLWPKSDTMNPTQ